jgi:hypothetical protein
VLTSAAMCGGRPTRWAVPSQKSRSDPAETGSAANGSSMISENATDGRPASGCRALTCHRAGHATAEPAFAALVRAPGQALGSFGTKTSFDGIAHRSGVDDEPGGDGGDGWGAVGDQVGASDMRPAALARSWPMMRSPESLIYGRWPEDLTTALDRLDGADLAVAVSAAVAVRAR